MGGGGNLKNAVIAFLAPLPSVCFYIYFLNRELKLSSSDQKNGTVSGMWKWCYENPFLLANTLFFLNVNVLFWFISLLQSSHWMISLYWTAIPVMLAHYYASHPYNMEKYNKWRSRLAVGMTWWWSIRLAHSYLRRECWRWGAREDWRFTNMRRQYGSHFWWASFVAIYLSQQIFLTGVCLPLYIIHSVDKPLNIWDLIALIISISGIIIAYYADTQLHDFKTRNHNLKQLEKPLLAPPILDKGLWRFCRHPNYFGEQLWWWGLVVFAWNLGHGWAFIGPLINGMSLAYVTKIVEDRMLKEDYRAEAYRQYQKTTSMWIPWIMSSSIAEIKDKNT